jgi:hypothetical protein
MFKGNRRFPFDPSFKENRRLILLQKKGKRLYKLLIKLYLLNTHLYNNTFIQQYIYTTIHLYNNTFIQQYIHT